MTSGGESASRQASGVKSRIKQQARSAYVHVPFCQQRCGYCDFAIIAGRRELVPRYLEALELELLQTFGPAAEALALDTLFVGGGTPTLLSVAELEQFLELLGRYFVLADRGEFTFEANPDLFSVEKQQLLADSGVNRISLGVQTFDESYLKLLERTHSLAETLAVIEQVQERFENLSLDLIFALPEQTSQHWLQTLQTALSLSPKHVSTYALTYEKGTTFWGKRLRGELKSSADTIEAEMYQTTLQILPSAGFEQYEISNFARPGFSSRHNEVYWIGSPYFAFGPGASRFLDGERSTNHRSSFTWMKRLETGESPVSDRDDLSPEERARELFAIGLRRNKGVNRQRIVEQTGCDPGDLLAEELSLLKRRGWLVESESDYRLTDSGRLFADEIAAEVI